MRNEKLCKFLYFFSNITCILVLMSKPYFSTRETIQGLILVVLSFIPIINLLVIPLRVIALFFVLFHDEYDEIEVPIIYPWSEKLEVDNNLYNILCYCTLLPWFFALINNNGDEEMRKNLYQGLILSLILLIPGLNILAILLEMWALLVLLNKYDNDVRIPLITALYETRENKKKIKKCLQPKNYSRFHSKVNEIEVIIFKVLLIANLITIAVLIIIYYDIPFFLG